MKKSILLRLVTICRFQTCEYLCSDYVCFWYYVNVHPHLEASYSAFCYKIQFHRIYTERKSAASVL
jgi:hypothetical protein